MQVQNITGSAISGLSSVTPGVGLVITIAVFVSVIIVLFLLSKNVRQFMYGAVVSGFLIMNYMFSRQIGQSAVDGNMKPLKWVSCIIGFIIGSIIIGRLIQRLKFVKRWEKEIEKGDTDVDRNNEA